MELFSMATFLSFTALASPLTLKHCNTELKEQSFYMLKVRTDCCKLIFVKSPNNDYVFHVPYRPWS